MIPPRFTIASLLVSTSLCLSACGSKSEESLIKAAMTPSNLTEGSFQSYLDVEASRPSAESRAQALAAMGLDDSGKGALSWGEVNDSRDSRIYKSLSVTSDDGQTINIDEMEIMGVRMEGDLATFDRLDLRNVKITDTDATGSLGRITISRPSAKFGNAILTSVDRLARIRDLDEIDIDFGEGDVNFGAIFFDDLNMQIDTGTVRMDALGWGQDPDTQKGVFLLEDLAVDVTEPEPGNAPVTVSLGKISATGLDPDYLESLRMATQGISGQGKGLSQLMDMNPFQQKFENYAISDLDIRLDSLRIASKGLEGGSRSDDGRLILAQRLNPVTFSFDGEATDPDIIDLKRTFSNMDLDGFAVSAESTTIMDEGKDTIEVRDSYFNVDNLIKFNFGYKASGIQAIRETAEASLSTGGDSSTALNPVEMLSVVDLSSLNLEIEDQGLVDRAITLIASEQGITPQNLKRGMKGSMMILGLAAQNDAQSQLASDFSTAVTNFIDNGGTLKLSVNPVRPMSLDVITNFNANDFDPDKMGITITHEP